MNKVDQHLTEQQTVIQKHSNVQPIWHFVLLCIAGSGIYITYWFYKNWKFIKEHDNLANIFPFSRAILQPLFAYSLFERIFTLAKEKGYKRKHYPGLISGAYIALSIPYVLYPNPYWLISTFFFIPLIAVVKALNYYWRQEQPSLRERKRFVGGEIAVLIIGGIVLIFVLVVTFMPQISKRWDAEAYSNEGVAYERKGQYDLAISNYNKAIEIDPTIALFYFNRGVAYGAKGQYDLAIADYTKAIEIDPKHALSYDNRGIAYSVKGQYDEAIFDHSMAIEINPRLAEAYNNRGVSYYFKKEYDKAWEDVHKAQSFGFQGHPKFIEALRKDSGRQE